MLVLTRRVGEEIVIDGNIRITVLLVKGDRVRIGVTAPDSVRVDRQEVHERRERLAGPIQRGTHVPERIAQSLRNAHAQRVVSHFEDEPFDATTIQHEAVYAS